MKIERINLLYDYVCASYLKRMPRRSIVSLENILFLMQEDSLRNGEEPFIPYKIFIEGNTIYIPVISDLLRVTRVCQNQIGYGKGWFGGFSKDFYSMCKYNKKSLMYKKMTDEQLQQKVDNILKNKSLDARYYEMGIYKNIWARNYARYIAHTDQHIVKALFYKISTFILILLYFILVLSPFILMVRGFIFKGEIVQLLSITVWMLLFLVGWGIWTKRWLQATIYELENKS